MEKMKKEPTNLSLRTDIKKRGNYAANKGLIPGIDDLSGFTEAAISEVCDRLGVPKKVDELEEGLNHAGNIRTTD